MIGSMGPMPGLPSSRRETPLLPKSKFVVRAMNSPLHSKNDNRGSLKLAHKTRAAIQRFSYTKPESHAPPTPFIVSHRKSLLPNLENPAIPNPNPSSANISTPWGRAMKIDSRYYKPQQGLVAKRSRTQEIAGPKLMPSRNSICKPDLGNGKNLPEVSKLTS